jgi:hypothetical protein
LGCPLKKYDQEQANEHSNFSKKITIILAISLIEFKACHLKTYFVNELGMLPWLFFKIIISN